jgi:hypothetical protein
VAHTSGSYVWVFWTLFIVGGVLFVGVGAFLPETARNMVGNGSDALLYKWWQHSWVGLVRVRAKTRPEMTMNDASLAPARRLEPSHAILERENMEFLTL